MEIFTTAIRIKKRIVARSRRIINEFGRSRRNGFTMFIAEEEKLGVFMLRWGKSRSKVVVVEARIIFFISRCWFGWITTKYENITNIPPM